MTEAAEKYFNRLYPDGEFGLAFTDPEFTEFFANFSCDETVNQDDLDDRTRMMAILAALLGCQGIDEFREVLPGALNLGVTPVEIKEIVYQACAYLGIGRVRPFFDAVNEVLTEKGVALPLEGQATTTIEDRVEKGEQAQVDIFGDGWQNHFERVSEDWRARVGEDDLVLLGGDISWGMYIEDAAPDYAAIAALPGKKIVGATQKPKLTAILDELI